MSWLYWCVVSIIIIFALVVGIVGPKRVHERCLEKGGAYTVGRDMLCFDKDRKLVL